MSNRKQGQTQEQASAKAGVSERSGRRIDGGRIGVLETKGRDWRTRKDPFAEVWNSEVVELLEHQPGLDATTLFENLQDRHPGRFGNGGKRTFQRRGGKGVRSLFLGNVRSCRRPAGYSRQCRVMVGYSLV